ncbi:MAG: hypothetical protein VX938_00465, partial [Myxococcota bacterium]|nr:hypothetical protein [Myxococcota bacterium]
MKGHPPDLRVQETVWGVRWGVFAFSGFRGGGRAKTGFQDRRWDSGRAVDHTYITGQRDPLKMLKGTDLTFLHFLLRLATGARTVYHPV